MPSTERTWIDFQEYIPGHLGQHSSLTHWAADLAFFRISTSGAGTNSVDIGTNNADISRSAADIDKNIADIGKNAADIGKNPAKKLTKNQSRSLMPHSPGGMKDFQDQIIKGTYVGHQLGEDINEDD